MSRRVESYDSGKTYVARRIMTIDGRRFEQGEEVPRNIVAENVYKRWFDTRRIVSPRLSLADKLEAKGMAAGERDEEIPAGDVDQQGGSGTAENGDADETAAPETCQPPAAIPLAEERPAVAGASADEPGLTPAEEAAADEAAIAALPDGAIGSLENGYICESSRGWFTVVLGEVTKKVRGAEAAGATLRSLQDEAGIKVGEAA